MQLLEPERPHASESDLLLLVSGWCCSLTVLLGGPARGRDFWLLFAGRSFRVVCCCSFVEKRPTDRLTDSRTNELTDLDSPLTLFSARLDSTAALPNESSDSIAPKLRTFDSRAPRGGGIDSSKLGGGGSVGQPVSRLRLELALKFRRDSAQPAEEVDGMSLFVAAPWNGRRLRRRSSEAALTAADANVRLRQATGCANCSLARPLAVASSEWRLTVCLPPSR